MHKAVITLLSDQVVPASLFILSAAHPEDTLFVITTARMKEKGKIDDLTQSLQNRFVLKEIIVDNEDSIADVSTRLDEFNWKEYDEVLIDLTLGTKIMSLGVHSYFSRFHELYIKPKITFYYQPAGKNVIKTIDSEGILEPPLLSLEEYLSAYGITIINQQTSCTGHSLFTQSLIHTYNDRWKNAAKLFRDIRNAAKPDLKKKKNISLSILQNAPVIKKNKEIWQPSDTELQEMAEFCTAAGFDTTNLTKSQIEYLTGGWLEEWLYEKVREIQPQPPQQRGHWIALSLNIRTKNGTENEFDVALVNSNNAFRYAECKTSLENEQNGSSLIENTLYKQSALRKNFGLSAAPIIVTVDTINDSARKRAQDLDIRIICQDDIQNEEILKEKLIRYLS